MLLYEIKTRYSISNKKFSTQVSTSGITKSAKNPQNFGRKYHTTMTNTARLQIILALILYKQIIYTLDNRSAFHV